MMRWGKWPGWFGLVGGVLVALAVVGVLLARGVRERTGHSDSAEEVLAQRFARGEIDDEEFTRRRATLRGTR
jgi:putative membrane protein